MHHSRWVKPTTIIVDSCFESVVFSVRGYSLALETLIQTAIQLLTLVDLLGVPIVVVYGSVLVNMYCIRLLPHITSLERDA